MARVNITR
jgi:hypothetical protein